MNGNPGLKSSLIDREGFPRSDVDLMETRKLRHRHACLDTDYKSVMKKLEQQLFNLHSDFKQTDPAKNNYDENQPQKFEVPKEKPK